MADDLGIFSGLAKQAQAQQQEAPQNVPVEQQGQVNPVDLGVFSGLAKQANAQQAQSSPGMPSASTGKSFFEDALSSLKSTAAGFAGGVKRGIDDIAEGGVQTGLKLADAAGIDTKAPQERLQALRDERIATYGRDKENAPVASSVGNILGSVAAGAVTTGATSALGAATGATGLVGGALAKSIGPVAGALVGGSAAGAAGSAALTYGDAETKGNAAMLGATFGGLPGAYGAKNALAKGIVGNTDEVAARVANAKSLGVDLTLGQATQRPGILNAEKALSEAPLVGTKGMFERQLDSTKNSIANIAESLKGTNNSVADVDKAYEAFAKVADDAGATIPLSNVQKTITEIQRDLKIGGKDLRKSIDSNAATLLDDLSKSFEAVPGGDIMKLDQYITGVKQQINPNKSRSLALVGEVKKALHQDLEQFANASGNKEILDSFNAAKDTYKSQKTSELVTSMLEKSTPVKTGELNPVTFAKQISTKSKQLEATMSPENFQMLQGVKKLVQHTHQGIDIGKSESTTLKAIVGAVLAGLTGVSPLTGAAAGAATKAASMALTRKEIAPFLLKLATTKAGSKASDMVVKQLLNSAVINASKGAAERRSGQ